MVFINAGGGAVVGSPSWNAWQGNEYETVAGNPNTNSTTVNPNGLNVPQAVLQDYMTGGSGKYVIPVVDGTYQVSLIFEDPYSNGIGQRVFNILANGVTEVASYDIYKAAGAANKATEVTFDVNASGGTGLTLALQSITNYTVLSGIEISRVNPAPTTWTASAEVSYDGGNSWTTIATGLALIRWAPVRSASRRRRQPRRVSSRSSPQRPADGFRHFAGHVLGRAAGSNFYINTTGSDSNSGKSPGSPMASLAALLNIYTLQPGDTIYVGAGTYTLPSAIVFGAADSGSPGDPIQIIGQGPTTIFKSASNASTSSVFQFTGAHDVTIENLAISGGGIGINILANAGASDISLQGLDISGFSSEGISVGANATNFSITGSAIHDPLTVRSYDGIDIDTSVNATISDDSFTNLRYGVNASGPIWLAINNNTFTTDSEGVNIGIDGSTITGLTVNNNTVTSPTGDGLYIDLPYNGPNIVFIENNTVSGSPYDGIFESALRSSAGIRFRRARSVWRSRAATRKPGCRNGQYRDWEHDRGRRIYGTGATVFRGNTISGNAIGIYNNANSTLTTISNNLLLNNTSIAINNNGTG